VGTSSVTGQCLWVARDHYVGMFGIHDVELGCIASCRNMGGRLRFDWYEVGCPGGAHLQAQRAPGRTPQEDSKSASREQAHLCGLSCRAGTNSLLLMIHGLACSEECLQSTHETLGLSLDRCHLFIGLSHHLWLRRWRNGCRL